MPKHIILQNEILIEITSEKLDTFKKYETYALLWSNPFQCCVISFSYCNNKIKGSKKGYYWEGRKKSKTVQMIPSSMKQYLK